ncbi:MAG TPA: succinate dehydrogenase, hydrophobic membrane anchor protein [Gammaproteobacteria bacterium]|nr:succinate dehydrogenase, hydrophobic membrane anchor protein [Gammaproteobacteria bacterium]
MAFRSPIKEARGLGAAHHGVGHWWAQRVTAIALVPLLLWFVVGVAAHSSADYAQAVAWIGSPVNAVLMILSVAVAFYHGSLGVQVILEDYVDSEGLLVTLDVLQKFVAVVFAAAGIFAVLKIAFGG